MTAAAQARDRPATASYGNVPSYYRRGDDGDIIRGVWYARNVLVTADQATYGGGSGLLMAFDTC